MCVNADFGRVWPEVPEAHGQGTIEEAKESLAEAIELIHELRVEA